MFIAFGKHYVVGIEWLWSVFVYSWMIVLRSLEINLKVLQVKKKCKSAENVVMVGDWSITSYLQWCGKSLWDRAEVVSPQSEVGKPNEGSKRQRIHIPLTQQIPLQFQGNQAAQTFDRAETYMTSPLVPLKI